MVQWAQAQTRVELGKGKGENGRKEEQTDAQRNRFARIINDGTSAPIGRGEEERRSKAIHSSDDSLVKSNGEQTLGPERSAGQASRGSFRTPRRLKPTAEVIFSLPPAVFVSRSSIVAPPLFWTVQK
ncbi:putative anthranilate synthase [Desulfovibrio ferrophilus]|uniref:Putative anthranilate synthase n=1 Tax=Desulfovibrio ferrophilus TaxID=241368 RepID=A0A2Z6B046_9BACT|nr:putative anthranilate synthase [Desulfovibrio ferrophilus]